MKSIAGVPDRWQNKRSDTAFSRATAMPPLRNGTVVHPRSTQ
jgi:hypothetical protein